MSLAHYVPSSTQRNTTTSHAGRDVTVNESRVPSAREMEIRMLCARVREISDMRRMRTLDYPYSRNDETAFQQQYEDMMNDENDGSYNGSSGMTSRDSMNRRMM